MQTFKDKKDNRGGWRGGGRPKKFGKDITTTTISARIPVMFAEEAKEKMEKMVEEFSERISNSKN